MLFLAYHRDRAGSGALRDALLETHWSYMDRFADGMIARGPTLTPDGETATGSIHILELPDVAAARAFVFDEPTYQAGVYRDVLLRRWRNVLGRTMWEFPGDQSAEGLYLVIGLGHPDEGGRSADTDVPPAALSTDTALIAYGPLLADDGTTWLGTAAMLRAQSPDAARSVLEADHYAAIEVHHWCFGGRR